MADNDDGNISLGNIDDPFAVQELVAVYKEDNSHIFIYLYEIFTCVSAEMKFRLR